MSQAPAQSADGAEKPVFYLKEDLKWDYLWAGLCILGAVFFVFREKLTGA